MTDTSNGTGRAVSWTITVADGATDYLAAGQTVTEVFAVQVADNHGGTATQNVTVTVAGRNHCVVRAPSGDPRVVTEDVAIDGSGNLNAGGAVTFSDVDLTDTHGASVRLVSSTHGTALGALSLGTLTDTSNGTGGAVGWTYTVADGATDYLAAGQTVTEVFAVQVADNHGGTATQNFTFTVTATTEIHTLSLHDALPILTEDVAIDGSGNLNAGGAVTFSDVDLTDT